MTTFISLAISDTMFPDNCSMSKIGISAARAKDLLERERVLSALNPSHATTIDVIWRKFGISLLIPERAPKVALQSGDQLIVIQAQLPRLAEGEVHSADTVENAKIKFSLWKVQ